jgi:hypothetical protein
MIESKGLNFLRNIKIEMDFHANPFKRMLREYKTLVVKMNDDVVNNIASNINYEFMCDVETIMGLMCLLPMLETMQGLCHDPSLGLAIKAKAWQGASQECNPRITFTLPGMRKSVRE